MDLGLEYNINSVLEFLTKFFHRGLECNTIYTGIYLQFPLWDVQEVTDSLDTLNSNKIELKLLTYKGDFDFMSKSKSKIQ